VPTGGAGLGLAIVASVTAVHGGRVAIADAESGQGLAVTIHLPNPDGPGVTGVRDRREPAR
jgi:signal transduction histidine kinase